MAFWRRPTREDLSKASAAARRAIEAAEAAFKPWRELYERPTLSEIMEDPDNPKWKRLEAHPEKRFARELYSALAEAMDHNFEAAMQRCRTPGQTTDAELSLLVARYERAKKLAETVVKLAAKHGAPRAGLGDICR
jgi:hypothetical protein